MKSLIIIASLLVAFSGGPGENLPKIAQKRINNTISKLWPDVPLNRESIEVNPVVRKELKLGKAEVAALKKSGQLVGYMYIADAPSKFDRFDYMVVYAPDLSVLKTRILVYREDYGGEICSNRWLKQFDRKTVSDDLRLGRGIDGISGATISCRSMCVGMVGSTQHMSQLRQKGII